MLGLRLGFFFLVAAQEEEFTRNTFETRRYLSAVR